MRLIPTNFIISLKKIKLKSIFYGMIYFNDVVFNFKHSLDTNSITFNPTIAMKLFHLRKQHHLSNFKIYPNVPITSLLARLRSRRRPNFLWPLKATGNSHKVDQYCISFQPKHHLKTSYLAKWRLMASKWLAGESKEDEEITNFEDENLWRQTISPMGESADRTVFLFGWAREIAWLEKTTHRTFGGAKWL